MTCLLSAAHVCPRKIGGPVQNSEVQIHYLSLSLIRFFFSAFIKAIREYSFLHGQQNDILTELLFRLFLR